MRADDAALLHAVQRARNGDDEAFADVYRIVQPGLLGCPRGLVGESAEGVASDAWLETARDLPRFRGDGAGFRGWTATIARHRALDHLRRLRSRPRTAPFAHEVLDLPCAPEGWTTPRSERRSPRSVLPATRACTGPGAPDAARAGVPYRDTAQDPR